MEKKMDNEYRRAANITVIAAGISVLAWLFVKYALAALAPFMLAAIIAAIVSPAAEYLSSKSKIPRKVISAVLVLLFFAALAAIIAFGMVRLAGEIGDLIDRLTVDPEMIANALDTIAERIRALGERFGAVGKLLESDSIKQLGIDIDELLVDALSSILSAVTSAIPGAAMNMIAGIPSLLLFIAVFLLSAYYFCTDGDTVKKAFTSILPDSWQKKLPQLKNKIRRAIGGYVKAYLCLMAITFSEMVIGLSVLGVKYVFLMAILISFVDVLPILGTGAILVPWAIFSFATSDTRLGVGLLILYAASLVIRQIAEPKIVGSSLGIHPLATLASIYLGIRLIGIWGIFIGPISAMIIKGLLFKEPPVQSEIIKRKKL